MYNKRAWAIWSVATLFVAFQLFIGILFGISIKELTAAFSISSTGVSNIVALYFFSYAIMQIPAGLIIDRLSVKYTLFVVSLLIVSGLFILATTHSLYLAYLAAGLMGVASSFNFVSAVILIERWFNPKMFSVAVGMTSGCHGLIASLTAYFIESASPVMHISKIALTACLGIVISILILFIVKDYPKGTKLKDIEKKPINIFKAIYTSVSNVQVILASFVTALSFGAMLAFITFWNIQYQKLYGLDIMIISMLNITALTGIAVGAPLFGWISEKIGKRKPVGIGICVCLFLPLFVILQPVKLPMPVVFIAMFFVGFFANNVSIGFSIVKENSKPHLIGTSIAFANTVLFLGLSLFQYVPGKISSFLNIYKQFLIKSYRSTDISTMSMSFYVYLLAVILALIIHFFIKETYCKSRANY